MKRILISLGVVTALLVFVAAWCFRSCQKSMAGHGGYHQCQWNRLVLDMARYWYALDSGMTNAPELTKAGLMPYVQDDKSFVCPDGGTYSVDRATLCVVCSIPVHMFDTCKGNRTPPEEATNWLQDYPLDYRNSDMWWHSMGVAGDGTILRLSGATVVFKGLEEWGGGSGTMTVAGSGTSHGSSSSGGSIVTTSYANDVYTMSFAGHVLRISDRGRTLEIDKNTFDLSASRPRIVVETNGVVHVEEPRGL